VVIHRNLTCFNNIDRHSLVKLVCQRFRLFYIRTERRLNQKEVTQKLC